MISPNAIPSYITNQDTVEEQSTITPHDHDVLCGRGNNINQHKGNIYFRHLVKQNEVQYAASRKEDKPTFAEFIYNSIVNRTPPGRFIKQDASTGVWADIGKRKSIDKVRQALRENVPKIEKTLKQETAKRLEEAAKRMEVSGFNNSENSLRSLIGDVNGSVGASLPSQPSYSTNVPSAPVSSFNSNALMNVHNPVPTWISTIKPEQQAAACYLNDMTRSILSAPDGQVPTSQMHLSNHSTQYLESNQPYQKMQNQSTSVPTPITPHNNAIQGSSPMDLNASLKSLDSVDIPQHFHDYENGARVSLRLSFLGPEASDDNSNGHRASFQRRNSLFLSDIFDPKAVQDSIMKGELCEASPVSRESVVLEAYAQDIKENRESIVVKKRSSLADAVEMYFEDCENNEDMVADSDDENIQDYINNKRYLSSMNRRVSFADECIISMIVEQVVNEGKGGSLSCDIDDMSFS